MAEVKYLLDSNILSEPPKPLPNARIMKRLEQHEGEIATAAIVFHEMMFGTLRLPASRRRSQLQAYLDEISAAMPILHYDQEAARWHAAERARLYQKTPPFLDGQIAATAVSFGLVLVTTNVKHFTPFQGLVIENWASR